MNCRKTEKTGVNLWWSVLTHSRLTREGERERQIAQHPTVQYQYGLKPNISKLTIKF